MLARKSENLILLGRSVEKLEKIKTSLNQLNSNIEIFAFDVLEEGIPPNLTDRLVSDSDPIDICVHAIGGLNHLISESSWESYEKAMFLNLGFSHVINQLITPNMIKNNSGKIVHISSMVTKASNGNSPYVIAKSAIEKYVESYSMAISEKCTKININCISPGPINVPGKGLSRLSIEDQMGLLDWLNSHRVLAKRLGRIDEVVKVVDFLCGDGSDFMYGSNIRLDGGGV